MNHKRFLKNYIYKLAINILGRIKCGFYSFLSLRYFFKGYFKSTEGFYNILINILTLFLLLLVLIISTIGYFIIVSEELFAMANNEDENEDIGFSSESSNSSSDDSIAAEDTKLSIARRFDENFEEVMNSYQSLDHYSNRSNHDPIFIKGNLEYAIASTDHLISLISEGRLPDRGGTLDRMETIKNKATELLEELNSRNSNNTTNVGDNDNTSSTDTANNTSANTNTTNPVNTNSTESSVEDDTNNTSANNNT